MTYAHHESPSGSVVGASGQCAGGGGGVMGSVPVGDSDFSLSHADDMLNVISFLTVTLFSQKIGSLSYLRPKSVQKSFH